MCMARDGQMNALLLFSTRGYSTAFTSLTLRNMAAARRFYVENNLIKLGLWKKILAQEQRRWGDSSLTVTFVSTVIFVRQVWIKINAFVPYNYFKRVRRHVFVLYCKLFAVQHITCSEICQDDQWTSERKSSLKVLSIRGIRKKKNLTCSESSFQPLGAVGDVYWQRVARANFQYLSRE